MSRKELIEQHNRLQFQIDVTKHQPRINILKRKQEDLEYALYLAEREVKFANSYHAS